RLPKVICDADGARLHVGNRDRYIVHQPTRPGQRVERAQRVIPDQVHDVADVGGQVNLLRLPTGVRVVIFLDRDRCDRGVGDDQELAKLDIVTGLVAEIEVVP